MFSAILRDLLRRRVPHFLGVYLAVGWGVLEFCGFLVEGYELSPYLVDIALVALLSMIPTVLMLAYFHGGSGTQRWTRVEKIGVPLNLLTATAVIVAVSSGKDLSAVGPTDASLERATLDPQRIAVLYFDDHSEGGELEYVADALTEHLIQQLATVGPLRVLSRNAVKPYRDLEAPLDTIVRHLQVGTLVEGSVLGSGQRVRATVQLVDARTLEYLESAVVEGTLEDPFALLDELGDQITRLLRKRLGSEIRIREMRAGTQSVTAWKLVQRARSEADVARSLEAAGEKEEAAEAYNRADSLLAAAEVADPKWAEPVVQRSWLALGQARLAATREGQKDSTWLRAGIDHADRAVELEPRNAAALESRGVLISYLAEENEDPAPIDSLRREADRELRYAVSLDSTRALAWSHLSAIYNRQGRLPEARVAAEKAYRADAFLENAIVVLFRLCQSSMELKEWKDVSRWCGEGRRRYPDRASFISVELVMLASVGPKPEPDTVWQLAQTMLRALPEASALQLEPRVLMDVAATLARTGLHDSARAVIHRARSLEYGDEVDVDYREANARLQLGEPEQALRLLDRYLEAKPTEADYIAVDWWWDPLRDHPRFQALLARYE